MAAVSVKIHGLDVTLSTDANYGNLPVLLEVPEISSARFKIGDPVSSDQSTSLRCASTPELRQKLLQVSTDAYNIPRWLAYPMRVEDTSMLITNGAMVEVGDYLWVRSEKMQITGKDKITDATLITHGVTRLIVTRAVDGTPRGSYQMDDFEGTKGPLVSTGPNAFPSDVIGLWVTMSIHRDHSEKCLNPSNPNHHHLNQPCSREVFTGRISRIADAGDVVEIELQSGIQIMLDTAIPKICGMSPVSTEWESALLDDYPEGVRIAPMFAHPTDGGTSWRRPTAWKVKAGNWYWMNNLYRVIFSTGQFLRNTSSNGVRTIANTLIDTDPPVYTRVPKYPINYANWNAIVLEGSDGYTGNANPAKSRRDVSNIEYIPLAVVQRAPGLDVHDSLRTTQFLYNLGTTIDYPLYDPAPMGWYYPGYISPPYNQIDISRRTGRLDGGVKGGAEYRNPGVMRSGSYYKAYEWRKTSWARSQAPFGSFSSYALGQLWNPSMPAPTGPERYWFTGYVDTGIAPPTDRCIDLQKAISVFRKIDDNNVTMASNGSTFPHPDGRNWIARSHALPYGALRKTQAGEDVNIWLPETWVGRTLKDTVFTDQFQMNAVGWAPGKNGLFRPVWLADPNPEIVATITDDLLRDRDVTLDFEGNIPIGEVEISGRHETPLNPFGQLSTPTTTPEEDMSTEYIGGATTTRIISSDLLYTTQGRKVSIKMTNYLSRDGLPIAGNAIAGTGSGVSMELQKPQRIVRYVEDTWRRVVNRFGSPVPSVTVRLDGDSEVYPGDYVHLKLSQVKDRNGRLASDYPIVAMCVERGDRLDDATAEVEFLLVGWYTRDVGDWHPAFLFGDNEDGGLWEPFRTETVKKNPWKDEDNYSPLADRGVGDVSEGDRVGWVADLSGNNRNLFKPTLESGNRPLYHNRGIQFATRNNFLLSNQGGTPPIPQFTADLTTSGITYAAVWSANRAGGSPSDLELLHVNSPGNTGQIPSNAWTGGGFTMHAAADINGSNSVIRMKDTAGDLTLGTTAYYDLNTNEQDKYYGMISTAYDKVGTPVDGLDVTIIPPEDAQSFTFHGDWEVGPGSGGVRASQPITGMPMAGGHYNSGVPDARGNLRFAILINRVITPAERAQLEAYMRWVASI